MDAMATLAASPHVRRALQARVEVLGQQIKDMEAAGEPEAEVAVLAEEWDHLMLVLSGPDSPLRTPDIAGAAAEEADDVCDDNSAAGPAELGAELGELFGELASAARGICSNSTVQAFARRLKQLADKGATEDQLVDLADKLQALQNAVNGRAGRAGQPQDLLAARSGQLDGLDPDTVEGPILDKIGRQLGQLEEAGATEDELEPLGERLEDLQRALMERGERAGMDGYDDEGAEDGGRGASGSPPMVDMAAIFGDNLGLGSKLAAVQAKLDGLDPDTVEGPILDQIGRQLGQLEEAGATEDELEPLGERLEDLQRALMERGERAGMDGCDDEGGQAAVPEQQHHHKEKHRHHSKSQNYNRRHRNDPAAQRGGGGKAAPPPPPKTELAARLADELAVLGAQFDSIEAATVEAETLEEVGAGLDRLLGMLAQPAVLAMAADGAQGSSSSSSLNTAGEFVGRLERLAGAWGARYDEAGDEVDEDRWRVDELGEKLQDLQRAVMERAERAGMDGYGADDADADWRTMGAHHQTLRQQIHTVEAKIARLTKAMSTAAGADKAGVAAELEGLEEELYALQGELETADDEAAAAADAAAEEEEEEDASAAAGRASWRPPIRFSPSGQSEAASMAEEEREASRARRAAHNQKRRAKEAAKRLARKQTRAAELNAEEAAVAAEAAEAEAAEAAYERRRRRAAFWSFGWLPGWMRSFKALEAAVSPYAESDRRPEVSPVTEHVLQNIRQQQQQQQQQQRRQQVILPNNGHHDPLVKRKHLVQSRQFRWRWHRYVQEQQSERPAWICLALAVALVAGVFPTGIFFDNRGAGRPAGGGGGGGGGGGQQTVYEAVPVEGGPGLGPPVPAENCTAGNFFVYDSLADMPAGGQCIACEAGAFDHDQDPATPCVFCRKGYTSPAGSIICVGVPPSLPGYAQNPVAESGACPAPPCPACPALPCPALPCPALPCPALPCPALPCHGGVPLLPSPRPRPAPLSPEHCQTCQRSISSLARPDHASNRVLVGWRRGGLGGRDRRRPGRLGWPGRGRGRGRGQGASPAAAGR
eukprot:SAG22_NODE_25_length_30107_cov_28.456412_1_plen_1051_part_10